MVIATCWNCGGSGQVKDKDGNYYQCSTCGGSGQIEDVDGDDDD